MAVGWDACHGSPRSGGTRRLPDGSWVICNRAGAEVRVLARDVPALVALLTAPDPVPPYNPDPDLLERLG